MNPPVLALLDMSYDFIVECNTSDIIIDQYSIKFVAMVYNQFSTLKDSLIQYKLTTLSTIMNYLKCFLHVKNGDAI